MTKVYDNATNLITFARGSSGTALRRVGYGDELVTNGDFATGDLTGWNIIGSDATHSVTYSSGGLRYQSDTTSPVLYFDQNGILEIGKLYQITVETTAYTSGSLKTDNFTSQKVVSAGLGTVTFTGIASSATFTILRNSTNVDITIDNISVKEVFLDRPTDDLVLFNHFDDIPRIEYGSDGSLKGLLIEEQRTNLVTHSDFSSGWSEVRASLNTTTQAGPDGVASSSVKLVASTDNNSHFTTPGAVASGNYAVSVFAKAAEYSWLKLTVNDGGFPSSYFDLSGNGAIGAVSTGVTPHIESVGNGWFRCSVVNDTSITRAYVEVTTGDATSTFTGDGTSGIYLYGAQLEEGSFATSYIPTAGSQATRSADVASIPVSAFGYNQDAGTVVVEASPTSDAVSTAVAFALSTDAFGTLNRRQIRSQSTDTVRVLTGILGNSPYSTGGSVLDVTGVTIPDTYRAAHTLEDGYSQVAVNGSLSTADTSVSVPEVDEVRIGTLSSSGSEILNGHIKSIQYYPRRLTDAQLQELTS